MYGYNPTGTSPLSIALGEDSSSGSWAGVGTNGGVNIAIITNSCGVRWRARTADQNRFFAGVHEVMMNMPVGNNYLAIGGPLKSDTAQWSARGSTLANLIQTNLNQPASATWLSPSLVSNDYYGYGANLVAAGGPSAIDAISRLDNETWAQSQSDALDNNSDADGWYYYACNFSNCSSYGL